MPLLLCNVYKKIQDAELLSSQQKYIFSASRHTKQTLTYWLNVLNTSAWYFWFWRGWVSADAEEKAETKCKEFCSIALWWWNEALWVVVLFFTLSLLGLTSVSQALFSSLWASAFYRQNMLSSTRFIILNDEIFYNGPEQTTGSINGHKFIYKKNKKKKKH